LALALQTLIDQIARKTQSLLWETEEVRKTLLHSDVDEIHFTSAYTIWLSSAFFAL
jgi:hypothetical protein